MKKIMIVLFVISMPWLCCRSQSVLLNPTTTQVVTQPSGTSLNVNTLNGTNFSAKTFNNTVEANQFSGSDMCLKIQAALASLGSSGGIVEATHFAGVQTCSVDPTSSTAPLVLKLGYVTINSSVPWVPGYDHVQIEGAGRMHTALVFTAPAPVPPNSAPPAILTLGSNASGATPFTGVRVSGISIYSLTPGNVVDGILAQQVHNSTFQDVFVWGVTGCGIHTEYAVTDHFYGDSIDGVEAGERGIHSGSSPTSGVCFAANASNAQTTDGTVTDLSVKGTTGPGVSLVSTFGMTFTSGTSEENNSGISIAAACSNNTFVDFDTEAETANDVNDQGSRDVFISPSAPGSSSANLFEIGGSNDVVEGGTIAYFKVDSSGSNNTYHFYQTQNAAATLVDQGNNSNNAMTQNSKAFGYADAFRVSTMGRAGTYDLDTINRMTSQWNFGASSTTVLSSLPKLITGPPWNVFMTGTWITNLGGYGCFQAHFLEVNSTSPTLNACGVSLTFSVNSNGFLQIHNSNSTYYAQFAGEIEIDPQYGYSTADTAAIYTIGSIQTQSQLTAASLALTQAPTASKTAGDYSLPITLNGKTYYIHHLSTTP